MKRLLFQDGRSWIIATLFLCAALGVAAYVLITGGSSSAEDAKLQGVTTDELAAAGLHVTVADDSADVSAGQADGVALAEYPDARIIETVLVNMSNTGEFKEPRLAWAVNIDPASVNVPASCPVGWVCPSPNLTFTAYFVDAHTGEKLFFQTLGTRDRPVKATAPSQ